mmetsp:Transcript_18953/g.48862  ORF Transcript_18953/g.48862 Transcript_18953/m.48862 type:complete len:218 (+) Transcript_18953:786-1439(+)
MPDLAMHPRAPCRTRRAARHSSSRTRCISLCSARSSCASRTSAAVLRAPPAPRQRTGGHFARHDSLRRCTTRGGTSSRPPSTGGANPATCLAGRRGCTSSPLSRSTPRRAATRPMCCATSSTGSLLFRGGMLDTPRTSLAVTGTAMMGSVRLSRTPRLTLSRMPRLRGPRPAPCGQAALDLGSKARLSKTICALLAPLTSSKRACALSFVDSSSMSG